MKLRIRRGRGRAASMSFQALVNGDGSRASVRSDTFTPLNLLWPSPHPAAGKGGNGGGILESKKMLYKDYERKASGLTFSKTRRITPNTNGVSTTG